jgi:hypothetical protein
MRRVPVVVRPLSLVLMAVLMTAPAACVNRHVLGKYQDALDANRRNIDRLQLGMTRRQVEELLGNGDLIQHRQVRLTNPWHTEALRIQSGIKVEILYYVTQGYTWKSGFDVNALIPVVIENDAVVGWGRQFLMRNQDRYVLEPPPK